MDTFWSEEDVAARFYDAERKPMAKAETRTFSNTDLQAVLPVEPVKRNKNRSKKPSESMPTVLRKSIPEQLREEGGYIGKARVMKILGIADRAFYEGVRDGSIPSTRVLHGRIRIDPFRLANMLDDASTP
jgi:hypothetical protein